jgi:dephospho-CoA kinase
MFGGRTVRIGITGPIGCGKSTIAGWLGEAGAVVIDADDLAREVTARGEPGLDEVIARFGEKFRAADGSLDRAALGRLVFSDPGALRELEAIVHPLVRRRLEAAVARAEAADAPMVVIEAIKLVEGGYGSVCDEVWLVVCSRRQQRKRLVSRGLSPADADARIQAQGLVAERLRPAVSRVIDAAGSRSEVRKRVLELRNFALSAGSGRRRE